MKKKHKMAAIAMENKIARLEDKVQKHTICLDAHGTRLAEHDEEIEALGEGVNVTRQDLLQRVKVLESGMGHAAGNQIIQDRFSEHSTRLSTIEGILNNTLLHQSAQETCSRSRNRADPGR